MLNIQPKHFMVSVLNSSLQFVGTAFFVFSPLEHTVCGILAQNLSYELSPPDLANLTWDKEKMPQGRWARAGGDTRAQG